VDSQKGCYIVAYRCVKILVYGQDQPEQLASLSEFARVLTDGNNADKCAAVCRLHCAVSSAELTGGLYALLFKLRYVSSVPNQTRQEKYPNLQAQQ
jgi:hypothetical protein